MQAWKLLFLGKTTWGSLFINIWAITWLRRLVPDIDGAGLACTLFSGENPGDSPKSLGVWLWQRMSGLGVVIRRNSLSPNVGFLVTLLSYYSYTWREKKHAKMLKHFFSPDGRNPVHMRGLIPGTSPCDKDPGTSPFVNKGNKFGACDFTCPMTGLNSIDRSINQSINQNQGGARRWW